MASFFALTASVLSLGGSVLYNLDLFRGRIKPNLSTWLVWIFITLLNSSSYFVASADGIKSLLAFSNSAATVVTFGVIIWRGKFSRVTLTDTVAATIGILAGIVWFVTKSATSGNIVIQLAIAVGCLPTYRSVWQDASTERPLPWLMWGGGFVLAVIVVMLRWTGHPLELIYPLFGMLIYGGVGILAIRAFDQTRNIQSRLHG